MQPYQQNRTAWGTTVARGGSHPEVPGCVQEYFWHAAEQIGTAVQQSIMSNFAQEHRLKVLGRNPDGLYQLTFGAGIPYPRSS